MKRKMCRKWARKLVPNVVALLHGIPAARAEKERAEAAMKWLDFYKQYLDLLCKIGLPQKERRRILAQLILPDERDRTRKNSPGAELGHVRYRKENGQIMRLKSSVANIRSLMEVPAAKQDSK